MRGLTPLEYRLLDESRGHDCGSGEVTEREWMMLEALAKRGLVTIEECPRCTVVAPDDPDYEIVTKYSLLTPMGETVLRLCKALESVGGDL